MEIKEIMESFHLSEDKINACVQLINTNYNNNINNIIIYGCAFNKDFIECAERFKKSENDLEIEIINLNEYEFISILMCEEYARKDGHRIIITSRATDLNSIIYSTNKSNLLIIHYTNEGVFLKYNYYDIVNYNVIETIYRNSNIAIDYIDTNSIYKEKLIKEFLEKRR